MSLLVVGSVAYDSIETPFGKVQKTLGGSASYISLACSFFCKPNLVGVVGSDFKKPDLQLLKKHADISGLLKSAGKTFHWAGKYHFDLNTRDTLKTELGVFEKFTPRLSPTHKNSPVIFLGNIHPKLQLNVLDQANSPKFVGLDTMNLWIETAKPELLRVLKKIDVLIINESEARELTKEYNILKCAKKILGIMHNPSLSPLLKRGETFTTPSLQKRGSGGIKSTLIIKRGEYGLLMFGLISPSFQKRGSEGVKTFHLPGLPLENVVDPTGAGDSFAGGFMGYLAKTKDFSWTNLKKACVYGSVMASFCVESFGLSSFRNLNAKKIATRKKEFELLSKI